MTDYTKLVEALRILQDKNSLSYYKRQVCKDAADAIEKLITLYEKSEIDATNLTGKLTQAEAQLTDYAAAIEELKDKPWVESVQIDKLRQRIDELEEKQTYCDAYGDKWMTSGKDVPTAAYEHGYADGRDEAEAQFSKRCEIVRCRECKYWSEVDTSDGLRYGQCDRPGSAIRGNCFIRESWFCADGEREVQE